MTIFNDEYIEKSAVALLMQVPTYTRASRIEPKDDFAHKNIRYAAALVKSFIKDHNTPPSKEVLANYAKYKCGNDVTKAKEYSEALKVIKDLPKIPITDAEYVFERLENFSVGRKILDIVTETHDRIENNEIAYLKMRDDLVKKLLLTATSDRNRKREWLYAGVKHRHDKFSVTGGINNDQGAIKFGIKELDNVLGGMAKSFVTLLYSKTGGGKTRTAISIAYNAAAAGASVVYISLEMSYDLLASCFDSRAAMVDSNKIIFGKMDDEEKKKYREGLKKYHKEKFPIWIVDVSMGATPSMIREELELYRAVSGGNSPDLVIIDYANIMKPDHNFSGRSEKYDYLFQELHELAKHEQVAILTATQESRDASKADIEARKKKNGDVEQGVHNIGLSNYMAPHCETIIRLKQDNQDKLQNRLWMIIDKSRYGAPGTAIPVMALWDKTYVGDRIVQDNKIIVKRLDKNRVYKKDETTKDDD